METEAVEVPVVEYNLTVDYQEKAVTLAVYPEEYDIAYPALGLIEEIGELLGTDTEGPVEVLKKEMGDVCWYCSALAYDLGLSLSECYKNPTIEMVPDPVGLYNNAFRIAGRVKKILRGDSGREEKVDIIRGLIGDILVRIDRLAGRYGFTLMDVCETNLDKLFDRKSRGVLKGDGDNR